MRWEFDSIHQCPFRYRQCNLSTRRALRELFAPVNRPDRGPSKSRRARGSALMTPKELSTLRAQEPFQEDTRAAAPLPPGFVTKATSGGSITVYRGFSGRDSFADGWSWTLSKERAVWFAKRFERLDRVAKVATGEVFLDDVIAYLTGRDEDEIVADPGHVMVWRIERL